ncbi:glycosyltransferase [Clostridium sp.]|uniref:glycosyltransferase n=1 Tax=Clostridium sp. TaxID=1506 RepID=UPI003F2CA114
MHVMFIPSWYHNPRNKVHGSFFKEQALALQNNGIKVTVAYNEIWPLTLLGKIDEKKGLNIENEEGLNTYRYKGFNFIPKHPLMFKSFNKRMEKLYKEIVKKEGQVDIIHAQSSLWGGISAAYISKKYNIPLIITEHSSLERSVYLKESYKPLIKDSYNIADELIVVGNGLKEEIERFSGRSDIKVIHNLINLDMFKSKGKKEKEIFQFFSLAFLEGEKGMDTLIKSFSKGFKGKDAVLKIGGDGSQKDSLINLCKDLGIENQVEFLGALSREKVVEEMSNCNVFVLASRYETFGVVYIEALASGKPVIGTFNGGAEDIIRENNGILVNVDAEEELKDAMIYLKENINKYSSDEIRKECEERFCEEKIVKEIVEVYNLVLNKRRG